MCLSGDIGRSLFREAAALLERGGGSSAPPPLDQSHDRVIDRSSSASTSSTAERRRAVEEIKVSEARSGRGLGGGPGERLGELSLGDGKGGIGWMFNYVICQGFSRIMQILIRIMQMRNFSNDVNLCCNPLRPKQSPTLTLTPPPSGHVFAPASLLEDLVWTVTSPPGGPSGNSSLRSSAPSVIHPEAHAGGRPGEAAHHHYVTRLRSGFTSPASTSRWFDASIPPMSQQQAEGGGPWEAGGVQSPLAEHPDALDEVLVKAGPLPPLSK